MLQLRLLYFSFMGRNSVFWAEFDTFSLHRGLVQNRGALNHAPDEKCTIRTYCSCTTFTPLSTKVEVRTVFPCTISENLNLQISRNLQFQTNFLWKFVWKSKFQTLVKFQDFHVKNWQNPEILHVSKVLKFSHENFMLMRYTSSFSAGPTTLYAFYA